MMPFFMYARQRELKVLYESGMGNHYKNPGVKRGHYYIGGTEKVD